MDALPEELEEGDGWGEPLRLCYCVDDRVFATNADRIARLEDEGVAGCWRRGQGGHAIEASLVSAGWAGWYVVCISATGPARPDLPGSGPQVVRGPVDRRLPSAVCRVMVPISRSASLRPVTQPAILGQLRSC